MFRQARQDSGLLPGLMAAASGVLLTLALPPAGLWPAALALTVLFVMTAQAGGFRRAFSLGFWFGAGFFSLHLLWLPASLSQPDWFGPFFWLLYPPLLLLLATFWGLATGLARVAGGQGRGTLLLLPAAWVLTELLRHLGYFAFPWGTLGYMWLDTPVAQYADVLGVNGLSLLTVTVAALLATPFVAPVNRPRRDLGRLVAPLSGIVLLGALWFTGNLRLVEQAADTHTALLVQPNLDPFGRLGTPSGDLQIQTRLTAEAVAGLADAPDLVVWPEGSVIGLEVEGPAGSAVRGTIQESAPSSALIIGGRGRSDRGSHNRAWLLEDARISASYDKTVLVPFGETWPFMNSLEGLYRSVFGLLRIGMLENTVAGNDRSPLPVRADEPFEAGIYICYESVFPQVTADAVRNGAGVLVTITNDAWFARGNGARQHFDMGRMRAIETRRMILRSGLDGITGVVDVNGTTVAELPRNVASTLLAGFTPSDDLTIYVRYGGLLIWLLLGWIVVGTAGRFVLYGLSD